MHRIRKPLLRIHLGFFILRPQTSNASCTPTSTLQTETQTGESNNPKPTPNTAQAGSSKPPVTPTPPKVMNTSLVRPTQPTTYLSFVFYDVATCTQICNKPSPNPGGGPCQYFNIRPAPSHQGKTQQTERCPRDPRRAFPLAHPSADRMIES